MDTPLLKTKLFVSPARPGLVSRPRLSRQLEAAQSSPFTLVSAPAGFGKTTVLTQWISGKGPSRPFAWVQLDEGDNDPVRFWDYFIAALRQVRPSTGQLASAMLHSPQPFGIDRVLSVLINEMSDVTDDFAIVFDDYHTIKTEQINTGLAFLLDHAPPKMHLVMATRVDPGLPLAHFRGKGNMVEVRAEDLRFTTEEARDLLESQAVHLTPDDLGALNAKAEGWVVGLKMAAMAMRGRRDVSKFVVSFAGSQRYIMDYLVEEVLQQQPEEARQFLLDTSVLQKLTASLCDHVTGNKDGREMLARFENANLFLVPLDDSRQWYRYHHLFAELLRHQLEASVAAEEIQALHQRASQWFENNGLMDDAVNHAIAGKDWERAIRLLQNESSKRMNSGELRTALGWFQALPQEVLRSRPRLFSQYCGALVYSGQLETADAAIDYLERKAGEDPALLGEVASLRASMAGRYGDVPKQVEQAQKALSLLPADSYEARGRAGNELGMIRFYAGFLDEGARLLTESYEAGKRSGNLWMAANSLGWAGRAYWMMGDLKRSAEMPREAIGMAGESPAAASPM